VWQQNLEVSDPAFESRSRQPAADAFNAMLNYSCGILYSLVEKACILAGLEPFVGFLHTDNYNKKSLVYDLIEQAILLLRGQKVLLDQDLANLYGVETRAIVQAVKRNSDRFPSDFMFQLTDDEYEPLRSQIVISKRKGGRRYLPYAFTEQGVAMLSSVLHVDRAVQVNIEIMRAFVRLRPCSPRTPIWPASSKIWRSASTPSSRSFSRRFAS
jgi:hypothetical protein